MLKWNKTRTYGGNEVLQKSHQIPAIQELSIAAQFLLIASSLTTRGAGEALVRREVKHAILIFKQAGSRSTGFFTVVEQISKTNI